MINNPTLQAYLAANTLYNMAELYTFTLVDGVIVRYTTWDRNLVVGGNTFIATGPYLKRSAIKVDIGFEIDDLHIEIGAAIAQLADGMPFLQAVQSGRFDRALVKLERLFMPTPGDTASLAPITRFIGRVGPNTAGAVSAEITVRSLTELLDQQLPRNLVQPSCIWTLFDSGCTLSRASFVSAFTVAGGSGQLVLNTALAQATGYFDQGYIQGTSGLNSGVVKAIKTFVSGGVITLSTALPFAVIVGDGFNAYPGCDKTKATCFAKFANTANFRGEPFVPPPETVL